MVRLLKKIKEIIKSETVYDEVVKEIKQNKPYLYEIVSDAIDVKCGNDSMKIKELYAEVCCENERVALLSLFVTFSAFLIAIVALVVSIIKNINEIQLFIIIGISLLVMIIVEHYVIYDWDKYRYRHYVINVLNEKYKNIIG